MGEGGGGVIAPPLPLLATLVLFMLDTTTSFLDFTMIPYNGNDNATRKSV